MDSPTKGFENFLNSWNKYFETANSSIDLYQKKSIDDLKKSEGEFMQFVKKFKRDLTNMMKNFAQNSLNEAFLVWLEGVSAQEVSILDYADIFVKGKYIKFFDGNGKDLTIETLKTTDHAQVINKIRSNKELSLETRERVVLTYISFINWLSESSLSYISKAVDPDEDKRSGRVIAYPIFIKFLDQLKVKERVVAKLLYYGGNRTLEEVLELVVKDIDFKDQKIRFGFHWISYPSHVLEDINELISDKKSERVFTGRQGAPLNPATIFRNFKDAGSKVGLGTSFTPKALTVNRISDSY